MDVRRLGREDRADFAAFLAALPPEQWGAPSLCAAWRVRDVVAHVVSYDDLSTRGLLERAARGRFWSSRINTVALARYDSYGPYAVPGATAGSPGAAGLMAALGGLSALTEGVVHHQDVRRALGCPRAVPPERLLVALRLALLGADIGGLWRIRGCVWPRWIWRSRPGRGRGTAEALLMSIAGRRAAAAGLSDPGQRKLAERAGG